MKNKPTKSTKPKGAIADLLAKSGAKARSTLKLKPAVPEIKLAAPEKTQAAEQGVKKTAPSSVRMDEELKARLNSLRLQFMENFGRTPTNAALIYTAVMRWESVTGADVSTLTAHGGMLHGKPVFVSTPQGSTEYFKRILDLSAQFMRQGVENGYNAFNNTTFLRQAIRRWDRVSAADNQILADRKMD
jgi:hypothetical protein